MEKTFDYETMIEEILANLQIINIDSDKDLEYSDIL